MKRIDIVYEKLKEVSGDRGITAMELADSLGLSRANVSSDLNKLSEEGKVKKGTGRPVLFMPVKGNEKAVVQKGTSLDKFAEENQSLFTAIEQAKAAILYPPKGMHILILGETGVGKSMFAGLIHKYAIEMNKMEEGSPFVTFNCADYANNPQLLISQLFGTKKGAYTGADSDRAGLIERANGGILFLDEVHRLPAEGQEMFFTFMDKGIFRRLGETELERKSKVLIISATTEDPGSALLNTFTRRIPMVIHIPKLGDRSMEERFNLISNFLREECFRLDKEIMVSVNSMRAFLSYNCPNNIGQLKTDIQLACAKAYADYVSHRRENIKINSNDLPSYVREGLYRVTEHRQVWNKLVGINKRYCIFDKSINSILFKEDENEESIYDMIDLRVHELRSRGIKSDELEREMEKDIEEYFTKYFYNVNRKIDITNLENVVSSEVIRIVGEIVSYSEERLDRSLSEKVYYGMAVHISSAIERIKSNRRVINPQLNRIRTEYSDEFTVALDCLKIIERTLDVTMPIDEAGFLAMFLAYDKRGTVEKDEDVKVIVIAHGTSTASSMTEVANKLLGVRYAVGINAPLEEKPEQVLTRLKSYVREAEIKSDILFLVDMGSLTTFGKEIEKEIGVKTKTMPLVSTLHVIEAVRKAMMGYKLEDVYRETLNVNTFLERELIRDNIEDLKREKLAIITVCTTGEGSAMVIKKFLEAHLEFDPNIMEIIPVNLVDKESITSKLKGIASDRGIVCVVSSFNISTRLPQYGLEEVLSLRAINSIQRLIEVETTYIKMGETLEAHLKHVDGRAVFKDIKRFIAKIEKELNAKFDTDILIGITFHIGCMLDRIKSGNVISPFHNMKAYISSNRELYERIERGCSLFSEKYNIKVSEDELCYIMKFFSERDN